MTRLRKIEIVGFRGIRNRLSISLGANAQSLAIYAENAVGKSSVADALEWFFTDKVEHLWKENCKDTALRNTLIAPETDATVSLSFDDQLTDCTKTISNDCETSFSSTSERLAQQLVAIKDGRERIILRNVDLWDFILSTKTQKREALAQLIGYEKLDSFREDVRRSRKALESSTEYSTAKRNREEHQKDILKLTKSMVASEEDLFRTAQKIATAAGVLVTIQDETSYESAVNDIRKRIDGKDKAAEKILLAQFKDVCDELGAKAQKALDVFQTFSVSYDNLRSSEEDLRQISLDSLLTAGKKTLDESITPVDFCPLCLQPKPWDELKAELLIRIEKLSGIKEKNDAARGLRDGLKGFVEDCIRTGKDAAAKSRKLKNFENLGLDIDGYCTASAGLKAELERIFDTLAPIASPVEADCKTLTDQLDATSARVKLEIEEIALSSEEQKLFEVARTLENLKSYFDKYKGAEETIEKFETQIRTLSTIESRFSSLHTESLQKVLDAISDDISSFYLTMHPNEEVDQIKLRILGEGIEFEYSFHGQRVYPPLKYLSESHLNSMGIAAFLASARLFNKLSDFLVLDDVVTSFDSNHRFRILKLIESEFANRQIILLTHEAFWFEMIKKQLKPHGWLVSELELAQDGAVKIKNASNSAMDYLRQRKDEGVLSANDIRTALERILKDIAKNLEVKVAFRFNDQNERRMTGELLSELRAHLKKKSAATLGLAVFTDLETCNLIATTGSHDSGPVLNSGDINDAFNIVEKFDSLFLCKECGRCVNLENYVAHEGKAFCGCGKTFLSWKE